MNLRWATLLAAAGCAGDIVEGLYTWSTSRSLLSDPWLVAIVYATQLLLAILFVMLYREARGTGQPGQRQSLAIAATMAMVLVMQMSIGRSSAPAISNWIRQVFWAVEVVVLPLCWIAFLILLVKDAKPWQGRPMRVLAALMTVVLAAVACWGGYPLFFRVGMAWLNVAAQRSLWALAWNLVLLPVLELLRSLSLVYLMATVWRETCKKPTLAETT
ncbi:MAG TPA: hypothetical protein VG456_08345 [Candidatus Sulfopaludibacter sp.]|jgi:hypothetical protein|nr:hypothetical protein [Candidatus Sulfopaludibacter sp.]